MGEHETCTTHLDVKKIYFDGDEEVDFTQDRLGRVLTRVDYDGLTEWTYDTGAGSGVGQLAFTQSPFGVFTECAYEEAARGLLAKTQVTIEQADESQTFETVFGYDDLARPTTTEYPSASGREFATKVEYDPHSGQVVRVVERDTDAAYAEILDVSKRGQVESVGFGNGMREEFLYHPETQLLRHKILRRADDDVVSELEQEYYDNGLLKDRVLTFGNAVRTRTATYDAARRLDMVTETGPNAKSESFDFSPGGRLLSRSEIDDTYVYDPEHPRALASVGIKETEDILTFEMDLVLREAHPAYLAPSKDSQYCYKRGRLVFRRATDVTWHERKCVKSWDAAGEHDMGNIDVLYRDNGWFKLQGDWGKVQLHADKVYVEF